MSQVPAGGVEVTSSVNEQIGLPNWSHAKILVSAKAIVSTADYDAGMDFISLLVNAFAREQVETAANELNVWGGLDPNSVAVVSQAPWPVAVIDNIVELTFSMTEQISLPGDKGQNSNINILQSSKTVVGPGAEIDGFRWLVAGVKKQMRSKRDLVIANPRPWTQTS